MLATSLGRAGILGDSPREHSFLILVAFGCFTALRTIGFNALSMPRSTEFLRFFSRYRLNPKKFRRFFLSALNSTTISISESSLNDKISSRVMVRLPVGSLNRCQDRIKIIRRPQHMFTVVGDPDRGGVTAHRRIPLDYAGRKHSPAARRRCPKPARFPSVPNGWPGPQPPPGKPR